MVVGFLQHLSGGVIILYVAYGSRVVKYSIKAVMVAYDLSYSNGTVGLKNDEF